MNIEVDMTGFREAVMITGSENVRPLLQNCCIRYVNQLERQDCS